MRFLIRIGKYALQIIVFFCVMGLGSYLWAEYQAETYAPGATPFQEFPVVGIVRKEFTSKTIDYHLLRWRDIVKTQASDSPMSFKLPEPAGKFIVDKGTDYTSSVEFRILNAAGDKQSIEVKWIGEDHSFYAKYSTDGVTVWPAYFRSWGVAAVMIGSVPALILAWLFGRFVDWSIVRVAARLEKKPSIV